MGCFHSFAQTTTDLLYSLYSSLFDSIYLIPDTNSWFWKMQPLWDRERRKKNCERGVPGNVYLAQPPYIFFVFKPSLHILREREPIITVITQVPCNLFCFCKGTVILAFNDKLLERSMASSYPKKCCCRWGICTLYIRAYNPSKQKMESVCKTSYTSQGLAVLLWTCAVMCDESWGIKHVWIPRSGESLGRMVSRVCFLLFPVIVIISYNQKNKKNLDVFHQVIVDTLPETNIAPKIGCLEYYFLFGKPYFQGRTVRFREGIR